MCVPCILEKLVKAVKTVWFPRRIDAALRCPYLAGIAEADDKEYGESVIGCDEHIALALEAAEKA